MYVLLVSNGRIQHTASNAGAVWETVAQAPLPFRHHLEPESTEAGLAVDLRSVRQTTMAQP